MNDPLDVWQNPKYVCKREIDYIFLNLFNAKNAIKNAIKINQRPHLNLDVITYQQMVSC